LRVSKKNSGCSEGCRSITIDKKPLPTHSNRVLRLTLLQQEEKIMNTKRNNKGNTMRILLSCSRFDLHESMIAYINFIEAD